MTENNNLKKSAVALVGCDTYDDELVYQAVRRGLELIGGVSHFIKSGEKVVIKPNVLIGSSPDSCVCTHPSVFRAVGRLLLEIGVIVTCGDSSGFGGCKNNMKRAGLKDVADELGIQLADFDKGKMVTHDEALINKRFIIANGVLDADSLISLSKLKTHDFTVLTGAVKNQYGCIPGVLKNQQHARFRNSHDFCKMLVDLNMLVKPRLYIMDAVMAMEGNGPRSGDPRKLSVLLFSSDPVALDTVACKIINLDPALVHTCEFGEKAGLGTCNYDNINIIGDDIEKFICDDFKVIRKRYIAVPDDEAGRGIKTKIRGWFSSLVKRRICPRPTIQRVKCTACGICVESCPVSPNAVNWSGADKSKPPTHNYNRCIRCFCCQEFCPEGAISVQEPLLGRFLSGLYNLLIH